MVERVDFGLRHQNGIAFRAMLAFGQALFRTRRRDGVILYFGMSFCRDFRHFRLFVAARAVLGLASDFDTRRVFIYRKLG